MGSGVWGSGKKGLSGNDTGRSVGERQGGLSDTGEFNVHAIRDHKIM